jgi:hypothetical protein
MVGAQESGGTYEGGITAHSDGSDAGSVTIVVAPNAAAINAVLLDNFHSDCINEAAGGPITRELELYAPPVLDEGVGFTANEVAPSEPPDDPNSGYVNISLQGTFVSETDVRGTIFVYGQIPFIPPPLSPPADPDLRPCEDFPNDIYFNESFGFEASLVGPPAPLAPQPGSPAVQLPDTGAGPTNSGVGLSVWWYFAATAFVSVTLVLGAFVFGRRR